MFKRVFQHCEHRQACRHTTNIIYIIGSVPKTVQEIRHCMITLQMQHNYQPF
uniref:Uncharacterized protein n=1 Tax=Rhizophora mucronata TaxID=61149 RepID=A0A2P2N608_RHIMU